MTTRHELDALRTEVRSLNTALQKQSRTTKRLAYGFGCLFLAGLTIAATSMQSMPDVIKAKHFHVVGDDGKIVAALGTLPDGGMLGILNKDGQTVATLSPDSKGNGKLTIRNKIAKKMTSLYSDDNGGNLSIFNDDEKRVAAVYVLRDGGGALSAFGEHPETPATSLAATPNGGRLTIRDSDHKITFSAPEAEASEH